MRNWRFVWMSSCLSLAVAATAARGEESPYKLEVHGFVTTSLFTQDQNFGFGQGQGLLGVAAAPANAAPAATPPATPTTTGGLATSSGGYFGGDFRQSAIAFSFTGPEVFAGATPRAYLNFDLLGANSAGALGYESPIPRIFQAYAELKWKSTSVLVGLPAANLIVAVLPASVAHIANPVTYGAGTIGWRTPGVRVLHVLPISDAKLELGFEVSSPKWADSLPGATTASISKAWASNVPMLNARAKVDGTAGNASWMVYAAGTYERVNLEGFGESYAAPTIDGYEQSTISSYAAAMGGRLDLAPVSLQVSGYTGRGTGHLVGSFLQFGDIADRGGWAEVGVAVTPEWSVFALAGFESVDESDLLKWVAPPTEAAPAPTSNTLFGGMVRYRRNNYVVALEYTRNATKYATASDASGVTAARTTASQQLITTAGYFF